MRCCAGVTSDHDHDCDGRRGGRGRIKEDRKKLEEDEVKRKALVAEDEKTRCVASLFRFSKCFRCLQVCWNLGLECGLCFEAQECVQISEVQVHASRPWA